jgi:hypothetical protein
MAEKNRAIRELLAEQDNVITRAQALEHLNRKTVNRRIRSDGPWQVLLPGVIGAFTGQPTEQQRLRAALLYAGKNSFVTGPTGCRHYGLRKGPRCNHIHVASICRQRCSVDFVVIERTSRPTWKRVRSGVAIAPVARCLVDAALHMTDLDDVRAMLAEAIQRNKLSVQALMKEVARAPRQGSANARQAANEIARGARSAPECKQVRILSSSKLLPPLHYNCSLMGPNGFIAKPDGYCEESGVAQEIDSVEWHLDPRPWRETMKRRSNMVSYGVRVLEAAPSHLDDEPNEVRREYERTHLLGLLTGPPPGIWVQCHPDCPVKRRSK